MKAVPAIVCSLALMQILHPWNSPAQQPAATPAPGGHVIADSQKDFSDKQGTANWTYLYYLANKDGTMLYVPDDAQPMKWQPPKDDKKGMWQASQWFILTDTGSHPQEVNRSFQGWTVRRWTSDRSGTIRITGHIDRRDKEGDGTGVKVFVDGKQVFDKMLPSASSTDLDVTAQVTKGSRIDFVVTPGVGLDANNDSVTFKVAILSPFDT